MGRYSSVQAYADNNSNVRSISYEQATGVAAGDGNKEVKSKKDSGVSTEKVSNPYGSTAGAGSGDFHVYRHARAREAARWKELDAASEEQDLDRKFQQKLANGQTEEEQKTDKRRRKRQREKEAKIRKKTLHKAGITLVHQQQELEAAAAATATEAEKNEFSYIPRAQQETLKSEKQPEPGDVGGGGSGCGCDSKVEQDAAATEADISKQQDSVPVPTVAVDAIPNDGSFLELMKQRLAADSASKQTEDEDDGPMPPPAKKFAMTSILIDEDDEEGPMLPPGFQY